MRFKAIFFDFGGTLFSYADFLGSLKWLFLTIPLRLRVLIRPRMLKQGWLDASQEVYAEFTRSRAFYMHCDLYRAIFSDFAKRIGGNPTPEFLDWCLAKQKNIICKKFVLRKDCLSVLQKLSEAGLHLAVVSNIDDDYLHPMLDHCKLTDVLHSWTSSEEANSCKPDAAIFHHALQKADCQAEDVLFVGDNVQQDIKGARGVNMKTSLIKDNANPFSSFGQGEQHNADYTIHSLSELLPIVIKRD